MAFWATESFAGRKLNNKPKNAQIMKKVPFIFNCPISSENLKYSYRAIWSYYTACDYLLSYRKEKNCPIQYIINRAFFCEESKKSWLITELYRFF